MLFCAVTHHKRLSALIVKILVLGGFLALLAYLFHPGVGDVRIIVNGEPLGTPAAYFAALPTILLIMLFIAILSALVFLEVGMLLFGTTLLFGMLGVALLIPYFWPVLAIVLLSLLLASLGDSNLK